MSCSSLVVAIFNDQALNNCLQLLITDISLSTASSTTVNMIPITTYNGLKNQVYYMDMVQGRQNLMFHTIRCYTILSNYITLR